ncbi:MAG: hypothetical protein EOP62_05370 [Sphingomonadales bacterium]|nr:MAG: hypothetical protein EOP62_05370 [Sphingomonadales bacterium]
MEMRLKRWITGLGAGALCATAALIAPGLQAQGRIDSRTPVSVRAGIGSFTPAAADPKLAAMLARSGLPENGFRFTPSDSSRSAGRSLTVAVRARSAGGTQGKIAAVTAPSINLAPVAYNLGVSVGWKRFAASGDLAKVDMVASKPAIERADLGLNYTGKRPAARIQATGESEAVTSPVLVGEKPAYGYDLGGSYSLTRNLAVTAGVRYKSEDQRLPRLTDNRRDSQAVYVGTAFKF